MKRWTKLVSLLLVLCMCMALTSFAGAEEYADVIRIADDSQATSYDLHKDTSVNARNMLRGTVMEQLVTLKADGSIGMELAESVDINDTSSEFVFHLRHGVPFHNGKELTSEDVVASLNRWIESFSTVRSMVGDARFVADDTYTVSLKLNNSAIMLMDMLAGASQCAVVYPSESIAQENADTGFLPPEALIGTGPYVFSEWAVDQYVRLEKFEDYAPYGDPDQELDGLWGYKHAYTKTLMYYIAKDADTRVNGLFAGDYDFAVKVTDANLARVEADSDYTLYSQQTGMISLVWNKRSTDKYLRQAVQALANADDLNIVNYGELYDNDPCFMEDGQPGWYTTAGGQYFCQNDPEKARELLAQSSFDTTKPLRILYVNSGGAPAMVEILKQELETIGISSELIGQDRSTMTKTRTDDTAYDVFFTTFSSVPVPSLRSFLSADWAGWSEDETLQSMMLEMTTAATREEAFAAWEKIQAYCYEDYCPVLMLGHFHQAAACTNRLSGYNVFLTTNFWNAKLAK
ncbi:MAG: peptide ABC transporter substrate-binding protein [Clostridia bacterium]|nr:peptide ABC transporter substrate-binding protein [Clostridia bacterium]